MKASVTWKEGMAFDAHLGKYSFVIDTIKELGGTESGPNPKGLSLISLAGCTAMDVIAILTKMRVNVDSFEVTADSVIEKHHPKKFLEIVLNYIFKGENIPLKKVRNAVTLSMENYCGVAATLAPTVKISNKIFINGEEFPLDE